MLSLRDRPPHRMPCAPARASAGGGVDDCRDETVDINPWQCFKASAAGTAVDVGASARIVASAASADRMVPAAVRRLSSRTPRLGLRAERRPAH